ncbi:MAG: hypothetical protein WA755_02380 [Candidatus Acidiferrales bacterium]
MLAVGSVVTVGGLVLAICSDPLSAPYFGAAFALFIAFGFVGTYLAPYIAGFAERVSIRMSFLTPEELEESFKEEEENPHPGDNLVTEGLKETQNAVKGDQCKQLPFLRFNLGVSEFAVGNFAGATDAYKNALATASAENLEDGLAVASINDLEVFLHYCPGIRSADDCKKVRDMSDDLKQQFVTAAWPVPKTNSNSGDPRPRIRDLWLVANPAGLGWRAKLDNFNEGQDVLTVLWYKYEPKWDLWRGLPDLSREVDFKTTQKDSEGNTHEFRSYLAATGQQSCAQGGDYKAEFYMNGKRVNLQPPPHVSMKSSSFSAAIFRDLNVSLCHPDDWDVRMRNKLADQFMGAGYKDKAGSKGIFAFEYYFPRVSLDESAKRSFALLSMKGLNAENLHFRIADNEPNTCLMYPIDQTVLHLKSEDNSVMALA